MKRLERMAPWQVLTGGLAFSAATGWAVMELAGPRPGVLPGMLTSFAFTSSFLFYAWRRDLCPSRAGSAKARASKGAARSAAALLGCLQQSGGDFILISDAQGQTLFASAPGEDAELGLTWIASLHPEDIAKFSETQAAVLHSGKPAELELRQRGQDGSWRVLETRLSAQPGATGGPLLLTIARDITGRHTTWLALKNSEASLTSLVGNLPQCIRRKNRRGVVTFANGRLAKSLGRPLCEVVGKHDSELLSAETVALAEADEASAMQEKRPVERVVCQTEPDGEERWIHSVTEPLVEVGGEVTGVQVVSWDVTERERAQEALRRAHGESESLLAAISAVLIGVDSHGQIARWNRVAETVFGIPAAEAIGRTFFECGIQWDWPKVRKAILDCLVLARPVELHDIVCQRSGREDASLSLIFSPAAEGPVGGLQFILLATDGTRRRILESQLRQSQKMEAIGQLAAGIAHEINTPTQFIGGNLRFVRESFGAIATFLRAAQTLTAQAQDNPAALAALTALREAAQKADLDYLLGEMPKALDESLEGVERVARIVHAMKEFSHPGTAEKVMVNLNRAVESTVTVARNEWKYVAEVELQFDPALPAVPCHPGDINQVVLNLVVNAAHAIGETDRARHGAKGLIQIATVSNGRWVEIRVRDNGAGIPEGIRQRIFDPFFTTKEVGKGTGQGLFFCHRVVTEKHRGAISFESELGIGTTFIVRLPLQAVEPLQEVA